MFIAEPVLNRIYRAAMRSLLVFDEGHASPPMRCGPSGDSLLYIHIPFCESLCPYCSFHRVVYDAALARSYFDALHRELHLYRKHGFDFKGLYVGGGTPTVNLDYLEQTLGLVRELFSASEISVETNPNHLTDKTIERLKAAGTNRLSVGVQSFDDAILRRIGRYEKYGSGDRIRQRVEPLVGEFDTLNIDLMFNLPLQTPESLSRDLDILERLLPEQVTFYPLMVPPGIEKELTRTFGKVNFRTEKILYFMILGRMRSIYTGSTAWCFSRKASMIDEYIIAYDEYAGAGSGAFGYFNDRIHINTFSLDEYIRRARSGELPVTLTKRFSRKEKMYYYLLMKLFGLELSKEDFRAAFGADPGGALPLETGLLRALGCVTDTNGTLRLTDRGRYYWVMAMREFFIAVDTLREKCRELAGRPASRPAASAAPPKHGDEI